MSPAYVTVEEPAQQWWEVYPQVWAAELAALEAASLVWEQRAFPAGAVERKVGWVELPADSPWTRGTRAQGVPLRLLVAYPTAYPWFGPTVWLKGAQLPWLRRHRAPSGQLCLMHSEYWRPGMTLVSKLASQLPRLLTASDPDAEQLLAREDLAEIEVQAPEPSGLHRGSNLLCLVDSAWQIPAEVCCGYLLPAMPLTVDDDLGVVFDPVGHIARVYDTTGSELAGFPTRRLPQPYLPLPGRWLRLTSPPPPGRPAELWDLIEDQLPPPLAVPFTSASLHALQEYEELQEATFLDESRREATLASVLATAERRYLNSRRRYHGRVEIIGILHPDETTWRTTGWTFTFLGRLRADRRRRWTTLPIGTGYAGAVDLRARAPLATTLADALVTVVGVGAIGSRVAEALAQAGVGALQLIDRDGLEPGNLARHTAGLRHLGLTKAGAVAEQIRDRAPAGHVGALHFDVGATRPANYAINGHALMQEQVRHSDLVIDATADPAVTRYLAALCLADSVPFVHVSATAGGWGGTVVRIDPLVTPGCWSCLEHHRADHSVPVPPADPADDRLHPVGCVQPTFTGAAADLDTIALHAVRVITDRLAGRDTDIALLAADVFIATLHGADGPIPARWEYGRLTTHPACPVHGARAAAVLS